MFHRRTLLCVACAALASALVAGVAHGHGRAGSAGDDEARRIVFPDTADYVTLVADLHTHTVFSDGHVWPNVRVTEALRDGLDAVAITDHLEYQPHRLLVPNLDRNAAVAEARTGGTGTSLIIIAGSEITRGEPAGHMNAVFVEDANALWPVADRTGPELAEFAKEWPVEEAVATANAQGAFVFWNHPWSSSRTPDYRTELTPLHESLIQNGQLHGIEVVNGDRYNEEAHRIALDHDLTLIGTSDVHNLIDWDYAVHRGGHRPVTLALATDRSADGLKEALFAKRTVIWYEDLLIGRPVPLLALLDAGLLIEEAVQGQGAEVIYVTLRNTTDAAFRLRHTSTGTQSLHHRANLVDIEAHGTTRLTVKPEEMAAEVVLEFEVLNALTAPNTHPNITLRRAIEVPPAPDSFRYEGEPSFTITFPVGTRGVAPDAPDQVFAGSTPDGVVFQASVADIPDGLALENAVSHFIETTAAAELGSDFEVTFNKEITLADGTAAYRSEVAWFYVPAAVDLKTQIVSAYRDGYMVWITAHPRQRTEDISQIVGSLRFD